MLVFTPDHGEFVAKALEPVDGLSVTNVACTNDLLDFIWHEKFFEIRWDVHGAHWDVEVANDQSKLERG